MVLLCTVVEQESFTGAAKKLGHTPSHVSKEIARLEARLGTRLLNRTTRRISLTESGRIYYENARRIVDDARAVENKLHALGDRARQMDVVEFQALEQGPEGDFDGSDEMQLGLRL